jgi:hypothetical protein
MIFFIGGNQARKLRVFYHNLNKFNNFIFIKIFYLTNHGEIRTIKKCLDYSGNKENYKKNFKVAQYGCHGQKGNYLVKVW